MIVGKSFFHYETVIGFSCSLSRNGLDHNTFLLIGKTFFELMFTIIMPETRIIMFITMIIIIMLITDTEAKFMDCSNPNTSCILVARYF